MIPMINKGIIISLGKNLSIHIFHVNIEETQLFERMSHGAEDDVELEGAEVTVGEVQLLHGDHGGADEVCLDVAEGYAG